MFFLWGYRPIVLNKKTIVYKGGKAIMRQAPESASLPMLRILRRRQNELASLSSPSDKEPWPNWRRQRCRSGLGDTSSDMAFDPSVAVRIVLKPR